MINNDRYIPQYTLVSKMTNGEYGVHRIGI